MRTNECKRNMLAGRQAIGPFLSLNSPLAAEVLSHMGYDFILIDLQHGELSLSHLQQLLLASSGTATTPIVRVASNSAIDIQRALDLGAYGIVVPGINTKQECEDVVQSVRYAPEGRRSWGPFRASLYAGDDYFSGAAKEILVLVMIETAEGLANADDILSVEGIDGCFIGPFDLNVSLGKGSQSPLADEAEAAIESIFQAASRAERLCGVFAYNAENALARKQRGFNFITAMSDVRMLRAGASEILDKLK